MFTCLTKEQPVTIPKHIAVIPDGNRRYSRRFFMNSVSGYKNSGESLQRLINWSLAKGIQELSIYAWSSENWTRPKEEIDSARSVDLKDLKHPEKDEDRAKDPEWLVMLGVCTHLGCVPLTDKGDYNAWFCPCHGSHYDTSGRIRKGPAPTNLEVPKYVFVNSKTIKIG